MLGIPPETVRKSLHKIFHYFGPNLRHIVMCRQIPVKHFDETFVINPGISRGHT